MYTCNTVMWPNNNNNNNNNNNTKDNVRGAVTMAIAIARVHPVHLMNEDQVMGSHQPSDQVNNLDSKSSSYHPYSPSPFITVTQSETSGYATWFTAGGAIRIAHYDVIDDVITRKL